MMKNYLISCIGCSGNPPDAPTGSSSNWDNSSKGVGTIVTYTCADVGPVTKVVCDAQTQTWLPAQLPDC